MHKESLAPIQIPAYKLPSFEADPAQFGILVACIQQTAVAEVHLHNPRTKSKGVEPESQELEHLPHAACILNHHHSYLTPLLFQGGSFADRYAHCRSRSIYSTICCGRGTSVQPADPAVEVHTCNNPHKLRHQGNARSPASTCLVPFTNQYVLRQAFDGCLQLYGLGHGNLLRV